MRLITINRLTALVLIHYCAVARVLCVVARAFLGSFWCIISDSNLARLFLSGFEWLLGHCYIVDRAIKLIMGN